MLNEHDREDGPEEGEYHFSDEGGYETGEEEAKAPVVSESAGLAEKFSSYRRYVIIGAVTAVVFLVAYLAVPSLTTSQPTEITAVNSPPAVAEQPLTPPPVSAPVKNVAAEQPAAAPPAEHKFTQEFKQLVTEEKEKIAAEKNKVMAHFTHETPAPVLPKSPPELAKPSVPAAEATGAETGLAASTSPVLSPSAQEFIASPMGTITPSPTAQAAAEGKAALDRLTAMEETNTKLIGQMHAEYAQKVADYEVQNKALQEQVHTLTTRLASMEAEMSKLVQALNRQPSTPSASESVAPLADNTVVVQGSSASVTPAPNPSGPPPIPMSSYKGNYTVQAIIPGRAWLRTESGETITVAEGDMLKSLGRVTKIDPYDGTILIDTGTKIITLTYGTGDYA